MAEQTGQHQTGSEQNPHEVANRAVKVVKLVAAISVFAASHGFEVVEIVEHADLRDWLLFSKMAKTNEPSLTTRRAVLTALREASALVEGR
jgi:hypothetical protein